MVKTVTLKHGRDRLPMRMEFFYDGQAVARNGLLTLPVDNMVHIKAAFFRGYQYTPEGMWLHTVPEVEEYIRSLDEGNKPETAPAPEPVMTAESAEVIDESDDTGRQPDTEHRVRSRQRKSRTKTTG